MTDEEYHKQLPLEEHSFSSSQVKQASKNIHKFYKEVVEGKKAPYSPQTLDAFTVGHKFHSHFLEPHTLDLYVDYTGRKAGKVWTEFQEANEGKRVLSGKMIDDYNTLVQGVNESEPALELLNLPFKTEVSFFAEIMGILVKCRYDLLHEGVEAVPNMELLNKGADLNNLNIGGDLKSTSSSDIEDEDSLRKIIKDYGYDISFAFYKDIYELVTGKTLDAWYWIIASKKHARAKVVWADYSYYLVGRQKYTKGMRRILDLIKDNWTLKDKAMTLTPSPYESALVKNNKEEEDDI